MDKYIGVFIPAIHKTGKNDHLKSICRYAEDAGYGVLCFSSFTDLFSHDNFTSGEKSVYYLAKMIKLSGIIIFTELIKDEEINLMLIDYAKELNIPAFCFEKKYDGAYYIGYDYENAFKKITDHVIEKHGARNIYMISGMQDNVFSEMRMRGYRRSLESHGIPFDRKKIYYGEFWDEPTKKAVSEILKASDSIPDAIVCANDTMAITVCNVLEERGILVPEQVIVTGIDGIERSLSNCPSITTAEPDCDAPIKYIFDTIAAAANGKNVSAEDKYFECALNLRQSCGCKDFSVRSSGMVTASLHDYIIKTQDFRQNMDYMTILYNDGRKIEEVLKDIGRYFASVTYCPISLYLDSVYFDCENFKENSKKCRKILAAYIDTENFEYHADFTPVSDELLFDKSAMKGMDNIIFVPVHSQDKVYGYVAAAHDFSNQSFNERLFDFVTHLNILLSSLENAAKLREMVKALDTMYIRDPLTNLYNRRGFYREIEDLILRAKKMNSEIMIVSVDLDGLKYINDSFGHSEGDFSIAAVANVISSLVDSYGIAARFGGDEFLAAVIYSDKTADIENKICSELEIINRSVVKPYRIWASAGSVIITADEAVDSLQESIKLADDKMFRQKRRSKISRTFRFTK